MTVVMRGDGRLMFSSRASRNPCYDRRRQMTSVEREPVSRPLLLLVSRRLFRAIARFISPMSAPLPSGPACGLAVMGQLVP